MSLKEAFAEIEGHIGLLQRHTSVGAVKNAILSLMHLIRLGWHETAAICIIHHKLLREDRLEVHVCCVSPVIQAKVWSEHLRLQLILCLSDSGVPELLWEVLVAIDLSEGGADWALCGAHIIEHAHHAEHSSGTNEALIALMLKLVASLLCSCFSLR